MAAYEDLSLRPSPRVSKFRHTGQPQNAFLGEKDIEKKTRDRWRNSGLAIAGPGVHLLGILVHLPVLSRKLFPVLLRPQNPPQTGTRRSSAGRSRREGRVAMVTNAVSPTGDRRCGLSIDIRSTRRSSVGRTTRPDSVPTANAVTSSTATGAHRRSTPLPPSSQGSFLSKTAAMNAQMNGVCSGKKSVHPSRKETRWICTSRVTDSSSCFKAYSRSAD